MRSIDMDVAYGHVNGGMGLRRVCVCTARWTESYRPVASRASSLSALPKGCHLMLGRYWSCKAPPVGRRLGCKTL